MFSTQFFYTKLPDYVKRPLQRVFKDEISSINPLSEGTEDMVLCYLCIPKGGLILMV